MATRADRGNQDWLEHDEDAYDELAEFFAAPEKAIKFPEQDKKGNRRDVKFNKYKDDLYIEKQLQGKGQVQINEELGRHPRSKPPQNEYYRRRLAERQAQLIKQEDITTERIIKELARTAFVDPRAFFDEEGNPIPIQLLDDDSAAALASFEIQELGKDQDWAQVKKYKLLDKLKALDQLGRTFNLYKEDNKREVDVKVNEISDTERARRVAFVLQEAMRARGSTEQD